jgi:hypothetical protein
MSVDGTWNIVLKTPIGEQHSTLILKTAGQALEGTMSGANGETTLREGAADGDKATWKADITQPMAITLEFSAAVEGDRISGSAKLGMFGNAPFSGDRA